MSEYDEDPVARLSGNVVGFAGAAYMAVEGVTQVREMRVRARAEQDERDAAAARAQLKAALGQARATWSIVLDPHSRENATLKQTGEAWAAAQAWRGHPSAADAEQASGLAEDRLRVLRPVAMQRYDRLVVDGAAPVRAMWQVVPLMDQPPRADAHTPREPLADRTSEGADLVPYQPSGAQTSAATASTRRGPSMVAGDSFPTSLHAAAATSRSTSRTASRSRAAAASAAAAHQPPLTR